MHVYIISSNCTATRTDLTAVAFGMLASYAMCVCTMCACAYRAANAFTFAVVIL